MKPVQIKFQNKDYELEEVKKNHYVPSNFIFGIILFILLKFIVVGYFMKCIL